ncbi:MAG: 16S rRNA processing protein RimM [Bacteroidales bacterium]|nr:16S rRNA processing protein RimM [Bacteroidales bacterium]
MFPSKETLEAVAQVTKSYGTCGEVLVSIAPDAIDCFQDPKQPVFLLLEGLPVPFFIEHSRPKGSRKFLVKFEDTDSLAEADALVGQTVYACPEQDEAESEALGLSSLDDLEGFIVFNSDGSRVGTVTAVFDFGGNFCLEISVEAESEPVLIPFHEDLVTDFQPESSTITMEIPAGLI